MICCYSLEVNEGGYCFWFIFVEKGSDGEGFDMEDGFCFRFRIRSFFFLVLEERIVIVNNFK